MAAESIVSSAFYAAVFLAVVTLFLYYRRGGQDLEHGLMEKFVSYGLGTFVLGLVVRVSVELFMFDSIWFNFIGNGVAAALILSMYKRSGNFSEKRDIPLAAVSTVVPGVVAVIGFLLFPFRSRIESSLEDR